MYKYSTVQNVTIDGLRLRVETGSLEELVVAVINSVYSLKALASSIAEQTVEAMY